MIVAMSCTKNWYSYVAVELYALFKHNNIEKVYLFIEDDTIPFIKNDKVHFINCKNLPNYISKDSPNYNSIYTQMSFLRCYFSKILNEDKILYIDADAIVVDNIQELWDIDLKDNVIAGVHEGGTDWNAHLCTYGLNDTYINSGVLLMDLKKIREEKLDDSMLYLLNHNHFWYPDQDVINLVCRNRIQLLSNIYNSTVDTGIVENAKIIHYVRKDKGWIKTSPRSEIWYRYYNEYMNKKDILISIITPYYKTLNYIQELAKILEPQLTNEIEWIIIDDGCSEQELDKLKAKVIHLEKNSGGGSVPRNVGLDNAKGEYILFIDSDDLVTSNYISTIVDKINKEGDTFNYCYISWTSDWGDIIIKDEPPQNNTCIWNCIYKKSEIGNERFNPEIIIGEDYDFNLRVRKGVHGNITDILYIYNINSPHSLTKGGWK